MVLRRLWRLRPLLLWQLLQLVCIARALCQLFLDLIRPVEAEVDVSDRFQVVDGGARLQRLVQGGPEGRPCVTWPEKFPTSSCPLCTEGPSSVTEIALDFAA